jgi:hypothetical protein
VPVKVCEAICACSLLSVTRIVKLYGPGVVGVPEIWIVPPVLELNDNPEGMEPAPIDHRYELSPPEAVQVVE